MANKRQSIFYLAAFLLALVFAITPFFVLAKASTGECIVAGEKGLKDEKQVGAFMQNICVECYDYGDCSLKDIMTVFANVGNFILGIIASLVFLMYVIGGVYWISSRGDKTLVDKGKKYIKGSTIGLLIVLFAYAGIKTLESALTKKGAIGGTTNEVICDGSAATEDQSCGTNKTCSGGACLENCVIQKGAIYSCMGEQSRYVFEGDLTCIAGGKLCADAASQCCAFKEEIEKTTTK